MSGTISDQPAPAIPNDGRRFGGRSVRRISSVRLGRAGFAVLPAIAGLLLSACGGGSGTTASSATASASSSSVPSAGATTATPTPTPTATSAAAGGSLGCLSGSWTGQDLVISSVGAHGGSGLQLTINGSGAMLINAAKMNWIDISANGTSGKMRYRGTETGHLVVKGNRLSGVHNTNKLIIDEDINGHSLTIPMSTYATGQQSMTWTSFSCTGSSLRLYAPRGTTWTFTKSA